MMLVTAGNPDVIATEFAMTLDCGKKLSALADPNLLEDVDALGVPFGATHVPRTPLTARNSNLGLRIGQTAPGNDTRVDTTGDNLMKIKESGWKAAF